LKLIDRYILKHFIQNLFFGLICFLVIFILVDLFENLDRFIDKKISLILGIQYYLYFIPEILKLVTPVAVLLSSLFTASRFVNYSELTAMKSAGISIYRYLLPIMLFGILLTGFSVYFNGWIVPKANNKKLMLERFYLGKNQIISQLSNLYIQDKKNRIITINAFDKNSNTATQISIQEFNPDSLNKLQFRADSRQMVWDSLKKDWKLIETNLRKFDNINREEISFYPSVYISELKMINSISLDPDLILKKQLKPEELQLDEFKEFVDNLERSGQEVTKAKIDYYSIISFPFASLVTILFGVSVSSNQRKGGAALQFGISILVSFIYLGFVKISQIFGYNGDIPPLLTAWLANIIFFIISAVNFLRLNKT